MPINIIALTLISLLILSGCASTTVIHSSPEGADIYIDNQKKGQTPYTYTDTKIAGSTTYITLKKDGYNDFETVMVRNEKADVGAIVGGCFLLVPFLWTMEYNPEHNYELTESNKDNNGSNQKDAPANGTTESNSTTELIKLKNLLDINAITQDEFTTLKVKILQEEYNYEKSIADQISKLYELYQQNLLTQAEYDSQKKKLIDGE